eukprot:CAMPEP_0185155246 /NCGR_PEP_ID=MMETSP1139-20130426/306_1 /TAXON_ID=298111 /ORGANISM="Pavlova sp., Strain CCMP459" /LENGTH=156 /DNA_ID=CAMNT_0027720135 /DNA_START=33 /DNA_END=504 /DNA_ORIENTATION=+
MSFTFHTVAARRLFVRRLHAPPPAWGARGWAGQTAAAQRTQIPDVTFGEMPLYMYTYPNEASSPAGDDTSTQEDVAIHVPTTYETGVALKSSTDDATMLLAARTARLRGRTIPAAALFVARFPTLRGNVVRTRPSTSHIRRWDPRTSEVDHAPSGW